LPHLSPLDKSDRLVCQSLHERKSMISNANFERVVAGAPVNSDAPTIDWDGYAEALRSDVVAASWCSFGQMNIEALVDTLALTVIHPIGILSSVGKHKLIGKAVKYDALSFNMVRTYGPAEHTDERGLGKFCIEFAGAGSVLLGRLQWSWRAKRFRDPRAQTMAAAEERDRILNVVNQIMG
jgi:hypothetical protein